MYSVRLVSADSYQAQPLPQLDPAFSEFRGSEIKHVPIIRVFGTLPTGEKTCLHIHGVFPYMYVPYTGEEDPTSLAYRLAASLDAAINVSLGSATSSTQHVYLIQRVSGIPFYGYHKKEHQFLKIYLYNPAMIKRAADLLQNGAVLNRSLQPHEAHIPYVLQFMMDYNVYGMSMINLEGVKHRRIGQSLAELTSSMHSEISESRKIDYLPNSVERQSTCELEIDALASDILNRREIEKGLDLNPGLATIWEEERARRAQAGLQGGDSQLVNPKSPPRPTFQPTDNDVYQEQRLARRLMMISQSDESTLSTTSNRSVAYAAEVREGENLLNSSNISVPVIQKSQGGSRDDSVEYASLLDSSTIVESHKLSGDCSVLGSDDLPLVDMLVELAGGNTENSESVDTDSVLGSQVSLLLNEPRSDNEDDDIPDLNLTSLQLDSLNDIANVQNPVEQRDDREDPFRDENSLSTVHLSPFLISGEAASSSSRSGDDENPKRKTKASTPDRMPQYDGAGDVSPTLANSSSSSDEDNEEENNKNAKEFSHPPKYSDTCEGSLHSRKFEDHNHTIKLTSRTSDLLSDDQCNDPSTDKSLERSCDPHDCCNGDVTTVTEMSTVSSPSNLTSDAYLGQYTAMNYEPFDRLLEIGPDFVPDLEGLHSSMEIGILLSSGDSDSPESVVEETDKDTIALDAVLNGDPCFTESAELDKSDVTELRDQYASLLGNSLLPDVHTNPRIDDDLGSASNFSDSDYQGNEKNCAFSLNTPSPRSAVASRDSSSSSENVTPNIQEPEARITGARRKSQHDCKELPRSPSDNSDYNCNFVATWAELQNIRQDKRLYRLRNCNTGQWIPGPRQSRRKADRRSLPNITTQLFGRVPESKRLKTASVDENCHRSPRNVPLRSVGKSPVKKTKALTTVVQFVPVECTIETAKRMAGDPVVETVKGKLSTSPLPNVQRVSEVVSDEGGEETPCQPLHTEASLAAFHRSIIGSDNPLAEIKKSSDRVYSPELFPAAESLVEPAPSVFEELAESASEVLIQPHPVLETFRGTSHYSSRRSERNHSSGSLEHRHCRWSVRNKSIIQDQVFTCDQIYIIEKRKRGKPQPPDISICTKGSCKLPFVCLSKFDAKIEARTTVEESSCRDLSSQSKVDVEKIVRTEEPRTLKISALETEERFVETTDVRDCLTKRKPRGRRKRTGKTKGSSFNDSSSVASTVSTSDEEPSSFESSDWAENEGRSCVRRITSAEEAHNHYNIRTPKTRVFSKTRYSLQTRESNKRQISATRIRHDLPGIPGIPGIIGYPKRRGCQRKIARCFRGKNEGGKPKKPLCSLLFPNWGAEREICESPPNGVSGTIPNGLVVVDRGSSVSSERRKRRSLNNGRLPISPLAKRNHSVRRNVNALSANPINRSTSKSNDNRFNSLTTAGQIPENETLNSMLREVKDPSTRAKIKLNNTNVEARSLVRMSSVIADDTPSETKAAAPTSPKNCVLSSTSRIPAIPRVTASMSTCADAILSPIGDEKLFIGQRGDDEEIAACDYDIISLDKVVCGVDRAEETDCRPAITDTTAAASEAFEIDDEDSNVNCERIFEPEGANSEAASANEFGINETDRNGSCGDVAVLTGDFDACSCSAMSVVFDTSVDESSEDMFDNSSKMIDEDVSAKIVNIEEPSNDNKQLSYRVDQYVINETNLFTTRNYTIDAVSLEIPTCLFEEDSNSVDQRPSRKFNNDCQQNHDDQSSIADDTVSSVGVDLRDLDVYDAESLTTSSSSSQLAEDTVESSLDTSAFSESSVNDESTKSEFSVLDDRNTGSGQTPDDQAQAASAAVCKETDDSQSEEDSPEFEALSPSPNICEILGNSLQKQFGAEPNLKSANAECAENFHDDTMEAADFPLDEIRTTRSVEGEEDDAKLDEEIEELVSHIGLQIDDELEVAETSERKLQGLSSIETRYRWQNGSKREGARTKFFYEEDIISGQGDGEEATSSNKNDQEASTRTENEEIVDMDISRKEKISSDEKEREGSMITEKDNEALADTREEIREEAFSMQKEISSEEMGGNFPVPVNGIEVSVVEKENEPEEPPIIAENDNEPLLIEKSNGERSLDHDDADRVDATIENEDKLLIDNENDSCPKLIAPKEIVQYIITGEEAATYAAAESETKQPIEAEEYTRQLLIAARKIVEPFTIDADAKSITTRTAMGPTKTENEEKTLRKTVKTIESANISKEEEHPDTTPVVYLWTSEAEETLSNEKKSKELGIVENGKKMFIANSNEVGGEEEDQIVVGKDHEPLSIAKRKTKLPVIVKEIQTANTAMESENQLPIETENHSSLPSVPLKKSVHVEGEDDVEQRSFRTTNIDNPVTFVDDAKSRPNTIREAIEPIIAKNDETFTATDSMQERPIASTRNMFDSNYTRRDVSSAILLDSQLTKIFQVDGNMNDAGIIDVEKQQREPKLSNISNERSKFEIHKEPIKCRPVTIKLVSLDLSRIVGVNLNYRLRNQLSKAKISFPSACELTNKRTTIDLRQDESNSVRAKILNDFEKIPEDVESLKESGRKIGRVDKARRAPGRSRPIRKCVKNIKLGSKLSEQKIRLDSSENPSTLPKDTRLDFGEKTSQLLVASIPNAREENCSEEYNIRGDELSSWKINEDQTEAAQITVNGNLSVGCADEKNEQHLPLSSAKEDIEQNRNENGSAEEVEKIVRDIETSSRTIIIKKALLSSVNDRQTLCEDQCLSKKSGTDFESRPSSKLLRKEFARVIMDETTTELFSEKIVDDNFPVRARRGKLKGNANGRFVRRKLKGRRRSTTKSANKKIARDISEANPEFMAINEENSATKIFDSDELQTLRRSLSWSVRDDDTIGKKMGRLPENVELETSRALSVKYDSSSTEIEEEIVALANLKPKRINLFSKFSEAEVEIFDPKVEMPKAKFFPDMEKQISRQLDFLSSKESSNENSELMSTTSRDKNEFQEIVQRSSSEESFEDTTMNNTLRAVHQSNSSTAERDSRETELSSRQIVKENIEPKTARKIRSRKITSEESSDIMTESILRDPESTSLQSEGNNVKPNIRVLLRRKGRLRKMSIPKANRRISKMNLRGPPLNKESSRNVDGKKAQGRESSDTLVVETNEPKVSVKIWEKRPGNAPIRSSKRFSSQEDTSDCIAEISQQPDLSLKQDPEEIVHEKTSVMPKKRGLGRQRLVKNARDSSLEYSSSQDVCEEIKPTSPVELEKIRRRRKKTTADVEDPSINLSFSQAKNSTKRGRVRKSSSVTVQKLSPKIPPLQNECSLNIEDNNFKKSQSSRENMVEERGLKISTKPRGRSRKNTPSASALPSLEAEPSQEQSNGISHEPEVLSADIMDEKVEPKTPVKRKRKGRRRKISAANSKTQAVETPSSQEVIDRDAMKSAPEEPEVSSTSAGIASTRDERCPDSKMSVSEDAEVLSLKTTDLATESKSPVKLKRQGPLRKKSTALRDHQDLTEDSSGESDFPPLQSSSSIMIASNEIETKSSVKFEKKNRSRNMQKANCRESSPKASPSKEAILHETTYTNALANISRGNTQMTTSISPKKRDQHLESFDLDDIESSSLESAHKQIAKPDDKKSPLKLSPRLSRNILEKSSAENTHPAFEEPLLKNTILIVDRRTLHRPSKRVRFGEVSIRRNTASLRPTGSLTDETIVEEPSSKKFHLLSSISKTAETILTSKDDKKSIKVSDIANQDSSDSNGLVPSHSSTNQTKDQTKNALNPSVCNLVSGTNGLRGNKTLNCNFSDKLSLDLSSFQKASTKISKETIYRDENLLLTIVKSTHSSEINVTETTKNSMDRDSYPAKHILWNWGGDCVQLRNPRVVLKRLSRDSLKIHGYTFRSKSKKFVKNLKRSSVVDDFRLPAYDGPADLTSSDSDDDPDVTIAREEKRVCVYQSAKKSASSKLDSIVTPKKRKLDEADSKLAGPSSKLRARTAPSDSTPTKSSCRSPSRTSMLKSPGRLSGYYSPLKIIVTSPKVRRETSDSRETVTLENRDTRSPSRNCVTPRRDRDRLHERMMRGRISVTKSSINELGEKHEFAATMASERSGELDGIGSSGHEELDRVSSTISNVPGEATRVRDSTSKDSRDVKKRLVFLATGENSIVEKSRDSEEETKKSNVSGEHMDLITIKETEEYRKSIVQPDNSADRESTMFVVEARPSQSIFDAKTDDRDPYDVTTDEIRLDNLSDRESRIFVAEPGSSQFVFGVKPENRDPYDVTTDEDSVTDDALDVTFSQYVDNQVNKNRALLDCSSKVAVESNDEPVVLRPKFNPPSRQHCVETMESHGIPRHRNQEPFFSVDADVPRQKELAHRILKVPGKSLKDVPAFVSSVEGVAGIARWRKMKIMECIPSLRRSNDVDVKIALCSNDKVVLTPLARPPTRKEAKNWLRAREYLAKKEKQVEHESKRKKMEAKEKKEIKTADTVGECSSKAADQSVVERSLNSAGEENEQERSLNLILKMRLANKGLSTERKSCLGSEEEVEIESQKTDEARRGSGDSNSSAIDPSLLSVLGKSRLFREQEASKHLGVSCGQIDFLSDSTRSNVDNENLQNAKALTRHQYLTIMCLEVHVKTRGDLLPDAQYDSIAAIFYAVQSDVPPTSTIEPLEHGVIVVAETEKAKNKMYYSYASKFPWSVSFAQNEEALLNSLVNLITRVDPEILIGWELETLSWGYVFQRASSLGMNLYKRISRIPATQGKWEAQPRDIETLAEVKLPGRIVLDIWRLMRHEAALLSYTFESVMHHVLNERISCPSFKILTDWWNMEKPRPSRWRVIEHYGIRVLGVFRILDQLDIIGRTSELARLFGIQFFEVFSRGSQYRVESVMLRLAKPLNYIAVSPSAQQRASMRAMEALPLIMEPESMFYSDPLIVLDFQSLYPSIIIAHNYCFSTCLGRIEHIGQPEPFEFGAYTLRVPKSTALKLQGKVNFAPCGVAFVKPEVSLGVLPRMLTEILETRFMVKKAMKDHKQDDKTLQRALHSRQMGLKFLANVTYGYTAANFSGRMPCIEVGDSVVSKAKETLERAIKLVERTPMWGARVVYGDTDSLFILVPGKSKADAFVIGNEIADAVTASNPPPIKLKFEKVVYPAILQTKKRYCGYMYETPDQEMPTYLAKGIETVRRDGCPAVSKILEKTLKILFETKDVSLVKKYVTRQLDKVLRGKVSIQDLTFAKEFRGLKGYRAKACVPALELTKRLMKKDPRAVPRNSERVRYVIVAGAPNQALIHCVRTPWELINDPGLRPNAIYYVTRVIIPPLNRCLNLMGVDVNAWYREMPHRHILDNPVGQLGDKQKLTIFQYFGTIVCAVCGQSSNKGICTECVANPPDALVVLHEKLRRLDRNNSHVTAICQSCVGQADMAECASLDCPVLYRRAQAQRELTQADHLRNIIECGNKLEL